MSQDVTAPRGIRRAITGMIGAQVLIGIALIGMDLMQSLPARDLLTMPTPAGPSTRPYAPDRVQVTSPDGLPSTAPMPERLEFSGDAEVLTLTGQIAEGDGARFTAELGLRAQTGQAITSIALDSTGGSVSDALEIGEAIRAAGLTTQMQGTAVCLSACPYIMAGGTERQVPPTAKVGVHQHYFGESGFLPAFMAVEDVQRGQAEVMSYLIRMGISPEVMALAMRTPPDQIYLLSRDELQEFGFIPAE